MNYSKYFMLGLSLAYFGLFILQVMYNSVYNNQFFMMLALVTLCFTVIELIQNIVRHMETKNLYNKRICDQANSVLRIYNMLISSKRINSSDLGIRMLAQLELLNDNIKKDIKDLETMDIHKTDKYDKLPIILFIIAIIIMICWPFVDLGDISYDKITSILTLFTFGIMFLSYYLTGLTSQYAQDKSQYTDKIDLLYKNTTLEVELLLSEEANDEDLSDN